MTAVERIKARIAELQGIRDRYLAYQQDRVRERDHHGAWDVAVNLSETECEISGLEFALKAMAEDGRRREAVHREFVGDFHDAQGGRPKDKKRPRTSVWIVEPGDRFGSGYAVERLFGVKVNGEVGYFRPADLTDLLERE